MASDSNSSPYITDCTDQNPKPNEEVTDQLTLLALNESENPIVDEVDSNQEGSVNIENGSLDVTYGQIDDTQVEKVEEEKDPMGYVVRKMGSSGGVDNGMDNSEHEIDVRMSPSSSGYAGERGTSSATSNSGI